MLHIVVAPVGIRRGKYVRLFQAFLGDRLICESKSPLLTSARILKTEGHSDATVLTISHQGSSIVSMKTTIGKAAGLIVEETESQGARLKKYRPFPSDIPHTLGRVAPRTVITEDLEWLEGQKLHDTTLPKEELV